MKKYLMIISMLWMCAAGLNAQRVCSVEHKYQADVTVYVVSYESQADLVVYRTDKEYPAKSDENIGIWCFVDKPYRADKKIYFVDRLYQADLKVFFTDRKYRAGWKNASKKHLMY